MLKHLSPDGERSSVGFPWRSGMARHGRISARDFEFLKPVDSEAVF
jgi:hypothetical protein